MSLLQNVNSTANPLANLNLTTTQQTQIQSILQGAKSGGESFTQVQNQIDGVLTPSQQQTLQTDLASGKAHSGHHHRSGGDESSAATDVLSPDYDAQTNTSSTAMVNGLTASDLQNQTLAARTIAQSQLQTMLLQYGTLNT